MAVSQEQSAGIEQVNQAVSQMGQVTQQNAALVEEAAAVAESLQKQASKLAEIVGVFKLDQSLVKKSDPSSKSIAKQVTSPALPNALPRWLLQTSHRALLHQENVVMAIGNSFKIYTPTPELRVHEFFGGSK